MKVSQMIKNLQEFKKKHGDLDCWYAVDNEGNECHDVYLPPSLCYVDDECAFYGSMEDVRYCGIEPEEVHAVCMVNYRKMGKEKIEIPRIIDCYADEIDVAGFIEGTLEVYEIDEDGHLESKVEDFFISGDILHLPIKRKYLVKYNRIVDDAYTIELLNEYGKTLFNVIIPEENIYEND